LTAYVPEQGDVVWLDFNPSKGHEQKGKHPAIVLSISELSEKSPYAWVVPITHNSWPFVTHISLPDNLDVEGTVQVEQLLTIDYKHRQLEFIQKLPENILTEILEMARGILG